MAMNVDKPMKMNNKGMLQLRDLSLAPYIQLATELIGKSRHAGGNMFRHQIDTMGILIDYGYLDSVLLKASVIHDLVEDVPGFDIQKILDIGGDAPEVLELVYEVTRKPEIKKPDYLKNIIDNGSDKAKILKCADRISNMISHGFIERYCDETEFFIFPIALEVDYNMYQELISLVITRRRYLEECGYFEKKRQSENQTKQ